MDNLEIFSYLSDRIKLRNNSESSSYNSFFQSYRELLNQFNKTRSLYFESFVERSKSTLETKNDTIEVNEVSSKKYRALEDKLYELQTELTNALRDKTQRAENLLQSRQSLRELEILNRSLKENESELYSKVEELTNKLQDCEQKLEITKSTIDLLIKQRNSLESEVDNQRSEITQLKSENQQLLNSLLTEKQRQAEEVNDANNLHIVVDGLRKEIEYLRERLNGTQKDKGGKDLSVNYSVSIIPSKVNKRIKCDHEGNSIVFSKNNEYLAVGLGDKTVRLYSTNTYSDPTTITGCTEAVLRIAFSGDSQYLLGTFNDSVNIWNTQNGRLKHTLTGHTKKIYAADFSGDNSKIVTGSHDRTLKVWDFTSGHLIKTLDCKSIVNDLEISFPDNLIVTGHFDKIVRVFDLKTQKWISDLPQVHSEQITSVNISKDSRLVVTLSRDNSIRIWDLRMSKLLNTITSSLFKNQLNWNKAVFSPDASYVAAGGADGKLFFWDVNTCKLSDTQLKGHEGYISSTAWKADGSEVATCGRDKYISIFK